MVEIVFKNNDVVVISKKAGIPSQADPTGDKDAMSYTKELLSLLGERDELWLVHRLDRVVGGLIVFARNKFAAKSLSEDIASSKLKKEYIAVVDGEVSSGILTDYIYKDSKLSKAFTLSSARKGAKYAELEYEAIAKVETERGVYTLVSIKLKTGRFHQIRVQFASRGAPLVGDGKYGSHDNRAKMPALFASRLGFKIRKEEIDIKKLPDISAYPWSCFESVLKERND